MEVLAAAISGLTVALGGLGAVMWKTSRSNGHQQEAGLEVLWEIKTIIQEDVRERSEIRRETARQFQSIAETLSYLKGLQG